MGTTTTRRNLRSKLTSAYLDSKDNVDDDETSDNFENNNRGIGNNGRRRRTSWYDNNQQQQSITKLDELIADNNSDMARYLLAGNKPKSCFARCRKGSSSDGGADNDNNQDDILEEDNIRSMGKFNTDAYSLSLEPIEIRSEKIIMLAEAYSIFGALFLAGTFVLYEWGSPLSYGMVDKDEVSDRAFSCVMAVGLSCNIFLALWGSILWIMAVVYGTRDGFIYEARHLIALCNYLMWITYVAVTYGLILAILSNLNPYYIEIGIAITFVGVVQLTGIKYVNDIWLAVAPLNTYHQPRWIQYISYYWMFTKKGRTKLKGRAIAEANSIKAHYKKNQSANNNRACDTSINELLSTAATSLGMIDYDVSIFEKRLLGDWFNDAKQLKDRSVECLKQYMPLRLAEEVHKLVKVRYG